MGEDGVKARVSLAGGEGSSLSLDDEVDCRIGEDEEPILECVRGGGVASSAFTGGDGEDEVEFDEEAGISAVGNVGLSSSGTASVSSGATAGFFSEDDD